MTRNKKTMDGNTAAAYVSYAFTEVAAIFPITPASDMAQHVDEWAAQGKTNVFGEKVEVIEMQSEAGASGTVHGSLQAGALTTTYTSSQGLLLMIPNMFKIAGELLPGVFHVSSRVVATNGLAIVCDHSDIHATKTTGFAFLQSSSVQEVMDLAAVAHLSAIKGRVPFLHFFDGFRTSHEIQKIEVLEYDELGKLIDKDALNKFRRTAMNPDHPSIRGGVQDTDIHFQQREVTNKYWDELPEIVENYMGEINKLTGRDYHLFNYYGAPDAERVIVAMGAMCQAIEEVVDALNAKGEKVGLLQVHLYRPFSLEHFFKVLPKTVKMVCVLDRVKEVNAPQEPLYTDVKAAFYGRPEQPVIIGGRAGVGGKDVTPRTIYAVFENMKEKTPKDHFTVGIVDDVTFHSLPDYGNIDVAHEGTTACKFWGLGSDGTVGANKSAAKIIGDHTDKYTQAFFAYDSKKSGGVTVSHLRFSDKPIRSTYLIDMANFISCSNQAYVTKYNVLDGLRKGGTFLLNTIWEGEELNKHLPVEMKKYIKENDINFYTINAVKIAADLGLGNRTNMILQSAFFKLSGILPIEDAVKYLKDSIQATYGRKGDKVVAMNNSAVDKGIECLVKIDPSIFTYDVGGVPAEVPADAPAYIKDFLVPVNRREGDSLPVSSMIPMEAGAYPPGAAAYEKRGIAINVPHWDPAKCIQCNQCSFVCPHGCIRPILTTPEETAAAPAGYETVKANGAKQYDFRMNVSVMDCTGCGNCINICPSKEKALEFKPLEEEMDEAARWDYTAALPQKENPFDKFSVKGSQFEKTFYEFSGACPGCGETPYIKLVSQLYGDRMMIAQSAGCAHVFTGSVPSNPYTTDEKGHGPSWTDSLFEDTAEFGLGQFLGTRSVQKLMASQVERVKELNLGKELNEAAKVWIDGKDSSEGTRARAENLIAALTPYAGKNEIVDDLLENQDYLTKRSQWIMGGDGWAYDIGYGGLDHVLASGENVNVLVLDTEVYSNTGGQASKATPAAAIAKFAAAGKKTGKKDLGKIAMSYGYIYVAQIAMGADKAQTLKAIAEAEAFPGPSLVIAYCPCINHGIVAGMSCSQLEEKAAVECGYWSLYRYDPRLKEEGKNPFQLDSKPPTASFRDFLMREVRYTSLVKEFPEEAEELLQKTERDAMNRIAEYQKMARDTDF